MDFESIAVNKIINFCSLTNRLSGEIPVGDKGISFDGSITLFNREGRKVEGYEYKVPVQVKSRKVEDFSGKRIKFTLQVTHLKNYIKRGGCILFVVEVNSSTGDTKPYFICLLPMYLRDLLLRKRENKYITLSLTQLKSKDQLVKLCEFMKFEMKKQHNEGLVSPTNPTIIDFSMVPNTPDIDELFKEKNLFKEPFSAYGHIDQMKLPVGIFYLYSISFNNVVCEYKVGDEVFSLLSTYIREEKHWSLLVEDRFELRSSYEKQDKLDYRLIKYGSVRTLLKTIDFIIVLLEEGSLKSKYIEIKFETENIDDSLEFYYRIKSELTRFIETSNQLSIPINLEIKGPKDLSEISRLNKIVLEKDLTGSIWQNESNYTFSIVELGERNFLFLYDPKNKIVTNPFVSFKSNKTAFFKSNGKKISTSLFLSLEYEAFGCYNFSSQTVRDSFENIDLEYMDIQFESINNFIINSIKAYDEHKNEEFISLVESLYLLVSPYVHNEENKDILFINYLQAKKRIAINNDWKEEALKLQDILTRQKENHEIMFCIYVILEDKRFAKYYFSEFSDERKRDCIRWPIYHLFEKL